MSHVDSYIDPSPSRSSREFVPLTSSPEQVMSIVPWFTSPAKYEEA